MQTIRTAIYSVAMATFVVLLASGSANAAPTIFQDRVSFNLALDSNPLFVKTVEGWDTYPPGTVFPNGTNVNGITYNVSTGEAQVVDTGQSFSPPNNLFQTAGLGFAPLTDTFTFEFDQSIRAFGINFVSSSATADGSYLLTTDLGDVIPSFFNPLTPGFPVIVQFAGFISDRPISRVEVGATVNALYGLDDLTFATIPEPSSLTLLSIGVLGLFAFSGTRSARRCSNSPQEG